MTSSPPIDEDIHYECMKHRIQVDAKCAVCRDPDLYCKFRPSCLIHFLEKEEARSRKCSQ